MTQKERARVVELKRRIAQLEKARADGLVQYPDSFNAPRPGTAPDGCFGDRFDHPELWDGTQ